MTIRPHSERLLAELRDIRTELILTVGRIAPQHMDYAPAAGMKSNRAILQEIGTMEILCQSWLLSKPMPEWNDAWNSVDWTDDNAQNALGKLEHIRQPTLVYLQNSTEERLQLELPVPPGWDKYLGRHTIEPEEIVHWIARHEYYHLGQIVSYQWSVGVNP